MKAKFPKADFHYATWNRDATCFSQAFPNERCCVFDEPEMNYHPFSKEVVVPEDVRIHYNTTILRTISNQVRRDWLLNSTKQILIHAMLLNEIKEQYDVIVRTRFDGYIWNSPKVNFDAFVEGCFTEDNVYGFMSGQAKQHLHVLRTDIEKTESKFNYRVCDFLIIHQRHKINYDRVIDLHNSKQLRGAEYGWHQILSEPFLAKHKNFLGWVTKDVITTF